MEKSTSEGDVYEGLQGGIKRGTWVLNIGQRSSKEGKERQAF